ncbi:MAG: hypothetical protein NZ480_08910 [Bdellovibrionaceae bacterium]|nr:hypothetical protein [Pseudobdellovibrionaceae bacterium]MDW8189409.1 hypothetical protein [Pseudobdellovibrionaceae bacterium]
MMRKVIQVTAVSVLLAMLSYGVSSFGREQKESEKWLINGALEFKKFGIFMDFKFSDRGGLNNGTSMKVNFYTFQNMWEKRAIDLQQEGYELEGVKLWMPDHGHKGPPVRISQDQGALGQYDVNYMLIMLGKWEIHFNVKNRRTGESEAKKLTIIVGRNDSTLLVP